HCYFIFQIMKLLYLFDTDSNWAVKKSSTYQKCFLSILASLLNSYKPVLVLKLSFSESLTINFFQVLSDNYFAEHHVDFYAGRLSVSPAHLNRILKNFTRMTAKENILAATSETLSSFRFKSTILFPTLPTNPFVWF